MEKHWSLINYKTKTINYRDKKGAKLEIQSIQKPLQLSPVTISQLAKCIIKGCQVYAIQVWYVDSKDKIVSLENIPVVQNFLNLFLE